MTTSTLSTKIAWHLVTRSEPGDIFDWDWNSENLEKLPAVFAEIVLKIAFEQMQHQNLCFSILFDPIEDATCLELSWPFDTMDVEKKQGPKLRFSLQESIEQMIAEYEIDDGRPGLNDLKRLRDQLMSCVTRLDEAIQDAPQ